MGYTEPLFNVRTVTGGYNIFPPGIATDDLTIYPNASSTYSRIVLYGNSDVYIKPASAAYVVITDGATETIRISRTLTDTKIASLIDGNDLNLLTTGTGVLKFGTYTAVAPAATGYITIKDAAGTTTKLLCTQ